MSATGRITPSRVVFEYDPTLAEHGSHSEYAAQLLDRAIGYTAVDVEGLVARYLAEVAKGLDHARAEQLLLRTARLLTEATNASQTNLRRRLGIDLATTLLPRLERTTQ